MPLLRVGIVGHSVYEAVVDTVQFTCIATANPRHLHWGGIVCQDMVGASVEGAHYNKSRKLHRNVNGVLPQALGDDALRLVRYLYLLVCKSTQLPAVLIPARITLINGHMNDITIMVAKEGFQKVSTRVALEVT